jgi:methionyl-tRNA formyltransferase
VARFRFSFRHSVDGCSVLRCTLPSLTVRVIFLGNVLDYSLSFLDALADRSRDPSDPVSLVAIIWPRRFRSRRAALLEAVKLRAAEAIERMPAMIRDRTGPLQLGEEQLVLRAGHEAAADVLWPASPSGPELCRRVATLAADVVIVAGLDRILREPTLSALPPVYNIHPSLLPEFRGAVPEFWQLERGLTEAGVTIHRLDEGVDTGSIVAQKRFAVEPWLDADGFVSRSTEVGVELMNAFLDGYPESAAHPQVQVGGSSQPIPAVDDRVAPYEGAAGSVFNRARASGWRSPLLLYVSSADWHDRQNLSARMTPARDSVTLLLFDPIPFVDHTAGPPGTLLRIPGGGLALSCNPGTVVFRRVEAHSLGGAKGRTRA